MERKEVINKKLYNNNSGLPKLGNLYGNRVSIVSAYFRAQDYYQSFGSGMTYCRYNQINVWWKKRETVKFKLNYRSYFTDSATKNIIEKLNNLDNKAKRRSNFIIDSNLFSLISNIDILKFKYRFDGEPYEEKFSRTVRERVEIILALNFRVKWKI